VIAPPLLFLKQHLVHKFYNHLQSEYKIKLERQVASYMLVYFYLVFYSRRINQKHYSHFSATSDIHECCLFKAPYLEQKIQ
jgi:hypothetical protein